MGEFESYFRSAIRKNPTSANKIIAALKEAESKELDRLLKSGYTMKEIEAARAIVRKANED